MIILNLFLVKSDIGKRTLKTILSAHRWRYENTLRTVPTQYFTELVFATLVHTVHTVLAVIREDKWAVRDIDILFIWRVFLSILWVNQLPHKFSFD